MIQNIIFDFDGTLVDTSEGIIKSMHYAFDKLNITRVEESFIRETIGPPLDKMLEELLKTRDKNLINKGIKLFRERYSTEGLIELELYKGVRATIEKFYNLDTNLFIATSKPQIFVEHITTKLDVRKYFKDISGVDINKNSLDKAKRIEQLIESHKLNIDKTIMVGDRCEDILAAKYNCIKCIGVTYGFGNKEDLLKEQADMICNNFSEIIDIIK